MNNTKKANRVCPMKNKSTEELKRDWEVIVISVAVGRQSYRGLHRVERRKTKGGLRIRTGQGDVGASLEFQNQGAGSGFADW